MSLQHHESSGDIKCEPSPTMAKFKRIKHQMASKIASFSHDYVDIEGDTFSCDNKTRKRVYSWALNCELSPNEVGHELRSSFADNDSFSSSDSLVEASHELITDGRKCRLLHIDQLHHNEKLLAKKGKPKVLFEPEAIAIPGSKDAEPERVNFNAEALKNMDNLYSPRFPQRKRSGSMRLHQSSCNTSGKDAGEEDNKNRNNVRQMSSDNEVVREDVSSPPPEVETGDWNNNATPGVFPPSPNGVEVIDLPVEKVPS